MAMTEDYACSQSFYIQPFKPCASLYTQSYCITSQL